MPVDTSVLDRLRKFIPIEPFGRTYAVRCPFHQERTPSCVVDIKQSRYHCFGCGAFGTLESMLEHLGGAK